MDAWSGTSCARHTHAHAHAHAHAHSEWAAHGDSGTTRGHQRNHQVTRAGHGDGEREREREGGSKVGDARGVCFVRRSTCLRLDGLCRRARLAVAHRSGSSWVLRRRASYERVAAQWLRVVVAAGHVSSLQTSAVGGGRCGYAQAHARRHMRARTHARAPCSASTCVDTRLNTQ